MGTIESSETKALAEALRSQRSTTQAEVDANEETSHGVQFRYSPRTFAALSAH